MLLATEVIRKKRDGFALSTAEIKEFITRYTSGDIPDYQMSALLMAIYCRGCNDQETAALTDVMLHSGEVVDLSSVKRFKADKHSTGGVGDKTSLILGPIVAAAGVAVPMISGRGLAHTGGTLDKLESIPGFNTQLSLQQFVAAVNQHNICFIGQTAQICPADKKIYALRDVTSTVESLPLICASIMSKKLAEGADGLVLDIKYGSGAFMRERKDCEQLARALMSIAHVYGKKCCALLTNMNQPLGRYAGNSLEVDECVAIMRGETHIGPSHYDLYHDTRQLSVELAAHMICLSGDQGDLDDCRNLAEEILASGKAYEKFEELVRIHGGHLSEVPKPTQQWPIKSSRSGFIKSMQTEQIGLVGVRIGAGRQVASDKIIPTAGIEFHVKVGDRIHKGDVVFTLHGPDLETLKSVESVLTNTLEFSETPVTREELIWKTLK